jgi:hypothetical protein
VWILSLSMSLNALVSDEKDIRFTHQLWERAVAIRDLGRKYCCHIVCVCVCVFVCVCVCVCVCVREMIMSKLILLLTMAFIDFMVTREEQERLLAGDWRRGG